VDTYFEMLGYIGDACDSLADAWWLKAAIALLGEVAITLIHIKHVQVLGAFILLVLIDLSTKWAALAYQMLIQRGADPNKISVIDKWLAIPLAIDAKIITSNEMRRPFVAKVLTYVTATAAAFFVDFVTGNEWAVKAVWAYLAGAEFLSILENLRAAGNATIGKFLEIVKDKVKERAGV
ncbi:MAG: phage holin family protein, partial [Negativicoccus succinicivorans]|nr:phage holin family protein [Negativicoccus succinicivorans]